MDKRFLLEYLSELIKLLNSTLPIERKPIQDKIFAVCNKIEGHVGISNKLIATIQIDGKEIAKTVIEKIE
jgi:hypothetical protein